MATQLTFLKETVRSEMYRISTYDIMITKQRKFAFRNKVNESYAEESDQLMLPFRVMRIVNRVSGAKSSHRCFQEVDKLLDDLASDFSNGKKRFRWN